MKSGWAFKLWPWLPGGGKGWGGGGGGTKGGGTGNSCQFSSLTVAERSHPMPMQIANTREQSRVILRISEERWRM